MARKNNDILPEGCAKSIIEYKQLIVGYGRTVDHRNPQDIVKATNFLLELAAKYNRVVLVEDLALVFGVSRQALHQWLSGETGRDNPALDEIKRSKELVLSISVQHGIEGTGNAVYNIFYTSNNSDYQRDADKTIRHEVALAPANAEELTNKYKHFLADATIEATINDPEKP